MAEDEPKGGGRPSSPSDLESLKAKLGLKAPRRATVQPVPPPAPEPPPQPAPVAQPPPPAARAPQPGMEPPPRPAARPAPRYTVPEPYPEPEPPPPKTAAQRWGKLAVAVLVPALMGGVIGYVV